MFSKSISKRLVTGILIPTLFIFGGAGAAAAFSVGVGNLQYSDDSGRSVLYDFSAGTVASNAINLSGLSGVVTPPGGETGVTYFWGQAPTIPPVTVTLDTVARKANVYPTDGFDGVAALYTSPGALPAGADPAAWSYSLGLGPFSVDMAAQKAYQFDLGLGRDESSGGPCNNATVNIIWVKGFYSGNLYPDNTLIIQAGVRNGNNDLWASTPIIRTGLDPAATTLAFSLAVTGGNHYAATVDINGEGAASLGEYTLTAGQGAFQRMPDLMPYVSMRVESASALPQPTAQSLHFQADGKYYAGFLVQDPLHLASAVRVTGNGNSYVGSGIDLLWDDASKSWYTVNREIGTEPVVSPYPSFTFTFTPQTGGAAIDPATRAITGYVTEFASNLLPTGNLDANPVFTWTGIAGAVSYGVELDDGATGSRIWNQYNIPSTQTSAAYSGPALETGKAYDYRIVSMVDQSQVWNSSLASGSFTYTGGAPTISFSGWVKAIPNWPSTEGAAGTAGATVSALSPATTPPTVINTAIPDSSTGAFTITGLPVATTFFLKVQPPGGYMPVLGRFINWNADMQAYLSYGLFTTGQYAAFGNAAGTGMILGRVALKSEPPPATTFLAGATVEAREWTAGSPPVLGDALPVTYSGGGSATGADGVYMVKSVPAGKKVQLTATLGGYTFEFNDAVVPVAADTISEESFFGTAVQSPFYAYSYHHQDGTYFINLFAEDAAHAFTGVTVNGPGLAGEVSLVYNGASWALPDAGGFSLGSSLPTGDRTYNFTAQTGGTPVTGSKTVSVYVEAYATNLQPAGDLNAAPTFSWTGIAGAASYALILYDQTAGGAGVWTSPQVTPPQTSIAYGGPALTSGHAYRYLVVSTVNTDGNNNASFAQGEFTYTAASNSGSVSGTLSYGGSQTGNYRLKVWSADMTGDYYQELTVTGGSFSFNNVPNGRYFLTAYRDSNWNGEYTAGEAYGYHEDANGLKLITVNGSGVNIGTVTLADPAAGPTGASVSINAAIGGLRGYLIFFRSGDFLGIASLQNGIRPIFSLDGDLTAGLRGYSLTQMQNNYDGMPVPAGMYDFYFMTGDLDQGPDKGVVQYAQTGVAVVKGSVTTVPVSGSIPFAAGGSVSGTVTSNFGAHHSLGRVSVSLTGDQAGQILKAWGSTDTNGQFRFDHLAAGTYYLRLAYAGYNAFSPIAVTVTEGQTLVVPGSGTVLTPAQTPATISGTLNPFGTGVDSRVLLKQGETVVASAATDPANGAYAISDVVPGSYTLAGSARGCAPAPVPVTVAAGQALTQNFNLNGTKSIITSGLAWLLAHQRADGSFDDNLSFDADPFVFGWTGYTGLTLLAVLENPKYNVSTSPAYLGSALLGQIHDALYGVSGATPKNGIRQYFEGTYHAADDPATTGWNDTGAFYDGTTNGLSVAATPVALEKLIALGMPLSDPRVTGAVQFLLGAQVTAARASNPIFAGGWRYNPGNTDTDNWETAWVIMALMKAGLNPTVQAVVDGLNHIRRSQATQGGGAGLFAYQPNDTSGYGPLGTSAACILALNFAGAPNSDPDVDRFFQWVKNNGGFNGYQRWADAYWWSMFPWAAILYDDPATSAPVKKYYDTLELTWNMADDILSRQNPDGSWSNPNYIPGGSNSGNGVMFTASALMAIAPYAGLTPLPDEATISGVVRNPAGAGVAGAKVEALLDGVVRASTVTNGSGAYTLSVPQNYAYTLRVTAAGYARKTIATADIGSGGLTGQDVAYLMTDADTAHPTISDLIPADGSTVSAARPAISAVLADVGSGGNAPSGIDPTAVSMTLDGNAVNASFNSSTGMVSFTPQSDLSDASHAVGIAVQDYAGNSASASWSFTVLANISFTGYVADSQSPSQAVAGATVEEGGLPANSTTTDAAGLYTLGGLKAGLPFYLKISKGADFAPCYSAEMTYTADHVEPRDRAFTLFPITRFGPGAGNWNVDPGKGVIRAAVRDKLDGYVGGAVVTATGLLQQSYAVCYDDDCTPSLTATKDGTGRYLIRNVLDGDTVSVTATKAGWTFNTRTYHTFAGGVSQGRLTGQGPVSLTVTVSTAAPSWSLLEGVQLQAVGFPAVSATTGANGSATLSGLPPNVTIPFSVGKAGYVNGYGQFSASSGVSSWRIALFTQANLTAWGVRAGLGVVYGRAIDDANSDNNTNGLTGVQVQCASAQGRIYEVLYLNDDLTVAAGATATIGNGRYVIPNVVPGDTVTLSARKAGWSLWTRTTRAYADGVSHGYLYGISGGATVTMYVNDKSGAAIPGATVRMAENTALSAASDSGGKVVLTNLPLDTPFTFEVIKAGYRNTYSRSVILTGNNNSWGTYTLFALNDSASFGGIPADRGVIHGWVKNDADSGNLAGARVSAVSGLGNNYTVVYLNNDYTIAAAATATLGNGRFAVLGVEPGDTVTVRAELAGWTFDPRTSTARANAVNQSVVYGLPTFKGDLDGNRAVNLADAIIALRALSRLDTAIRGDYPASGADVNNDGRVGPAEAMFILQWLTGMR
ncbi:MAG: carboxypeptidase regulatory-like domain-containing protein [Deltaproteobacteria bacterium]|nr:carboxypeptidase regulatory-like domain-containing protein [Deltaproteobacteria bacterium]